ncbi:MAG TPA: PHP-associated domain-containing protein [Candidatus Limnocylindria bacterium]|nr:PHP-associated domain-containing protein [Candidatus Limnocylindria bacterium]
MSEPGQADLHIHSLASDGISSVEEILAAAEAASLDVIAITDHERIDAAVAAQRIAEARGLRVKVIVGEEISTRSGHLLGLFLRQRIPPWRSLKWSVAKVHEQGGLAVIAHPLVPYPLCASAGAIRRLLAEADSIYHPDGIEVLNPTTAGMRWQKRVPPFAAELGLAGLGNSDAHRAQDVGHALTTFAGRTPEDLRHAIEQRETGWQGSFYPWRSQVSMFRSQLRKNAAALRDEVRGKVLRDGTGRDLGYPGGRRRPARLDDSQLLGSER